MALKDEDFLLKNDKDLEKAMAKLGLVLEEEKEEFVDPIHQFDFDMTALEEDQEDSDDSTHQSAKKG